MLRDGVTCPINTPTDRDTARIVTTCQALLMIVLTQPTERETYTGVAFHEAPWCIHLWILVDFLEEKSASAVKCIIHHVRIHAAVTWWSNWLNKHLKSNSLRVIYSSWIIRISCTNYGLWHFLWRSNEKRHVKWMIVLNIQEYFKGKVDTVHGFKVR